MAGAHGAPWAQCSGGTAGRMGGLLLPERRAHLLPSGAIRTHAVHPRQPPLTVISGYHRSTAQARAKAYISRTQPSALRISSSASICSRRPGNGSSQLTGQTGSSCRAGRMVNGVTGRGLTNWVSGQQAACLTCSAMPSQRGMTRSHSETRAMMGAGPVRGTLDSGPRPAGNRRRMRVCRARGVELGEMDGMERWSGGRPLRQAKEEGAAEPRDMHTAEQGGCYRANSRTVRATRGSPRPRCQPKRAQEHEKDPPRAPDQPNLATKEPTTA